MFHSSVYTEDTSHMRVSWLASGETNKEMVRETFLLRSFFFFFLEVLHLKIHQGVMFWGNVSWTPSEHRHDRHLWMRPWQLFQHTSLFEMEERACKHLSILSLKYWPQHCARDLFTTVFLNGGTILPLRGYLPMSEDIFWSSHLWCYWHRLQACC